MAWFVYLLECRGGRIYTGIATDVDRRHAEHAAGKGARFTRAHPPVRLLAAFAYPDRASASRAEYAIKQWTPARKRALCVGGIAPPAAPEAFVGAASAAIGCVWNPAPGRSDRG